jgi:hypothetical protein
MTKEIKLTREAVTIVDDEDFDFLNQYKWFLSAGYATRSAFLNEKSTSKQMHVYIAERMGLDMSLLICHKNEERLDNRRENLIALTYSQLFGRRKPHPGRKYKGVYPNGFGNFRAIITMNNKYTYIGTFASEIEAAKAYNAKAIKYFGEHAYLNPIEESNGQA